MLKFLTCRRTYVATLAILVIGGIGVYLRDSSVCSAIAIVAGALAGANALEGRQSWPKE